MCDLYHKVDTMSDDSPKSEKVNESLFISMVRDVDIPDFEKEIIVNGKATSILGRFKKFEKDFIRMIQDGTKEVKIHKCVVDCTGTSRGMARILVKRLLRAYRKPQPNGMETFEA